jgi:hypothetical protein
MILIDLRTIGVLTDVHVQVHRKSDSPLEQPAQWETLLKFLVTDSAFVTPRLRVPLSGCLVGPPMLLELG